MDQWPVSGAHTHFTKGNTLHTGTHYTPSVLDVYGGHQQSLNYLGPVLQYGYVVAIMWILITAESHVGLAIVSVCTTLQIFLYY